MMDTPKFDTTPTPIRKGKKGRRTNPFFYVNGSRLRRYRLAMGLSGRDLARSIGVYEGTIYKYENNSYPVSLPNFRLICLALNLDPLAVCDLLDINSMPRRDLNRFVKACINQNRTPLEVLHDFILVYGQHQHQED
jgi:transcriptional regulator with XRE-family HTH domain